MLDEYYQILLKRFGADRAHTYLEKKIYPSLSDETKLYFKLNYVDFELNELLKLLKIGETDYPPILTKLVWRQLQGIEVKNKDVALIITWKIIHGMIEFVFQARNPNKTPRKYI